MYLYVNRVKRNRPQHVHLEALDVEAEVVDRPHPQGREDGAEGEAEDAGHGLLEEGVLVDLDAAGGAGEDVVRFGGLEMI